MEVTHMKNKFIVLVFFLIVPAVLFSGCASTKKVRTLEEDKARLESEQQRLQQSLDESQKSVDERDQQIAALQKAREEEKAASAKEIQTIKQTYENLIQELKKEIGSGDIEIQQVRDRLQLTIAERLFFETGKADIKPEGQKVLRRIGAILNEEVGIDPLRLSAVSYGQYRPIASNKSSSGKAKNRRIEIILIDRDMDLAKRMRAQL
jgi:chemotaxis protein MotB